MTHTDRTLLSLSGRDATSFLQGLVTNDLRPLETGPGIVWAALLTPQGKYLVDFFVVHLVDGHRLIDIAAPMAADTLRRLTMYRLRADVQLGPSSLHVTLGLGDPPADSFVDPRHPALGWRHYGPSPQPATQVDWDAIRVRHVVPETGVELIPDETYILEAGFERLHGVDFRKGCYVGQEVTARMKHKTELRKGLVQVKVDRSVPVGTEILADGKSAGTLFTQSEGLAIAHLRFDRISQTMLAGDARVVFDNPDALTG